MMLPKRLPLGCKPRPATLWLAVGVGSALCLLRPWPLVVARHLPLTDDHCLAASAPHGSNIAHDSRVLFAEDFESGTIEQIGKRWSDIENKRGQVMALSSDVPPESRGR